MSDRIAAHWMELMVATLGILRGLATLADEYLPTVTPAVLGLPTWLGLVLAAMLVLGGAAWAYSIVRRFPTVDDWWAWQLWGLSLSGFGWLCYAITTAALHPTWFTTWSTTLAVSAGCWGMWGLVVRARAAVRRSIHG